MALLKLLLGITCVAAAKKASSDCTVKAVYPDGTEIARQCIVEGEKGSSSKGSAASQKISQEFAWLKETQWLWNEWRDVIFKADGSFLAPAEGCHQTNPKCRWTSNSEHVFVQFGNAGQHTLAADDDRTTLFGSRDKDGEEVGAQRRA